MLNESHCIQLEPVTLSIVGVDVVVHRVVGILAFYPDPVGRPDNGHVLSVQVALVLIAWLHALLLDVDRVEVEEQQRLAITTCLIRVEHRDE